MAPAVKARPVVPSRPPTYCRLSPLWSGPWRTPAGLTVPDPTGDAAVARCTPRRPRR